MDLPINNFMKLFDYTKQCKKRIIYLIVDYKATVGK